MRHDPKSVYRIFIKFMSSDRVDLFVNEGLLFMNNVDYFRKIENEDLALRGDGYEGLAASYDPNQVTLNIGGHKIEGTIGKIDIRYDHEDKTNLFCLTAINDQDLLDAQGRLLLSDDFKKFGEKAVLIGGSNVSIFTEMVKKAVLNDPNIVPHPNQEFVAGPVEYVPREKHHTELGVFKKFNQFTWQHEWRLAIKQTLTKGEYGEFRIGSIKDICKVFNTEELVSQPIIMKHNKVGL